MKRLLYVKASPMAGRSRSRAVADAFVETLRSRHPEMEVDVLDLYTEKLPPFDLSAASGKYAIMHGGKPAPEDAQAWHEVEAVINRFKAADAYVFAVPMWNFGIPYTLKHLVDVVVQPGLTFAYDPEKGYSGLVTGRKAFVAYARGGAYTKELGTLAYDMQKPYFDAVLAFMGITDVQSIVIEPTLMGGPQTADKKTEDAVEQARTMAESF